MLKHWFYEKKRFKRRVLRTLCVKNKLCVLCALCVKKALCPLVKKRKGFDVSAKAFSIQNHVKITYF
jgi:hypothetical protein